MAEGDLQSLGQVLRHAREARALALDEVEMQTRIRVKYLQALESGDLSVLPSVTHARGFLRNYAQFLQLDTNSLLAEFSNLTGAGAIPVTTTTAPPSYVPPPRNVHPQADYADLSDTDEHIILPSPTRPPQTQQVPRSTYVSPRDRMGPGVPRGAAPQQMYYPPQQAGDEPPRPSRITGTPGRIIHSVYFTVAILVVGFVAIVWLATTQLSKISVDEIVPTPEQSTFLAGFNDTTPSTTFEPTSISVTQTAPPILDRVLLNINVRQRSWVRITVDSEVQFEGQVDPGTVLQYEGQDTIILLAGNAAALDITYNGQNIGVLGDRGKVVQEFFTSTGNILTATSTPTVTPTSTLVPSPTRVGN